MKTLYVSDLDGTLLRSDRTVSEYTANILRAVSEKGDMFTVATSRGLVGFRLLGLERLPLSAPALMMGGVMEYDVATGKILHTLPITAEQAARIYACCDQCGLSLHVHLRVGDDTIIAYTDRDRPIQRAFLESRMALVPHVYRRYDTLPTEGEIVYLSITDTYEVVVPLVELLKTIEGIGYHFYPDCYSENAWFLEIFHGDGGKDKAVLRMKERLGADRVVAFGDNHNDIPMLRVADKACAVGNAAEDTKAAADEVIGDNDHDGVAHYLAKEEGL